MSCASDEDFSQVKEKSILFQQLKFASGLDALLGLEYTVCSVQKGKEQRLGFLQLGVC